MPVIETVTDEQENKLRQYIDDRVVEALNKSQGQKDPRQTPNYKRWMAAQGHTPAQILPVASESVSRIRAKSMVSLFLDSPEFKDFSRSSQRHSKTFCFEEALKSSQEAEGVKDKAAEVAVVADLREVLATEYDQELYKKPDRVLHIEDLMPHKPCEGSDIKFMQETGYTNNSALKAESTDPSSPTTITNSGVTLAKASTSVKALRTKISIPGELLDDIPELRTYLEQRIEHMGNLTVDTELSSGDNTGQHFYGIYTDTAHQSYLWSDGAAGDNLADAVLGGIIKAWLAEFEPDGIPMNPEDWGAIIKLKGAGSGDYLIPTAHQANTAKMLWGLRVSVTTGNPSGRCAPGSYSKSLMIRDRQMTTLDWTRDYGTDRDGNLQRLFLNRRLGFQKIRPEGICVVTFDGAPS